MVSSLSQTILVFGLGKTGLSLCHYLSAKNHTVFAIDEKSKHEFSIDISNVPAKNFFFGNPFDYLLQLPKDLDLILISPGIDKQHPFLKKVKECYPNITIAGEIEFLHRLITSPWIAVTGTDGKSTVSDLLRHIFERSHYRVFLGGNFGTPLAELIPHQKDYDIAVIELSSFQLEDTTELDPDVSIITNVAPDHLYRHHSFDEYVRCKANIFISQSQKHTAVLDYDEHLIAFRKQTNANLRWVSLKERPNEQNFIGCYYSHYEKKYYHIFTSANYETSHSFVINNEKLVGKFQPQNFMDSFFCVAL